ncbi:TPA: hypothetical protein N0F65_010311, partial [Lagenidium giganteum]
DKAVNMLRSVALSRQALRQRQLILASANTSANASSASRSAVPHRIGEPAMRPWTTQARSMGFFSDIKKQIQNEMENNEELKKSLQELQATKEKLQSVEKAAKDKMQEMSTMSEEAQKAFRDSAASASQKLKDSVEESVKNATAASNAQKETQENKQPAQNAEAKEGEDANAKADESEQIPHEPSQLDNARAFASKWFSKISEQKNKVINPKVKREWQEAARELFGSKEKQSVDDALSSVRTPSVAKPKKSVDDEEAAEYTGPSALVAVKEDVSAWEKIGARFREAPIIQGILDAAKKAARTDAGRKVGEKAKFAKDKIGDAREDVLEFWETSQNPWVYRMSSIYDGLFGETPMAMAIKEIRRAEPDFILEQWKENIAEVVLPAVLDAFLRGNSRDLKKWFGEAAYNRVNFAIRERKSEGLVVDPTVLDIENVEIMEASAEDKQAPIILMKFNTQQINCIRNREGEIIEGAEDEVMMHIYIFAFQRSYDEEAEALRWRIVEIQMMRTHIAFTPAAPLGIQSCRRSPRFAVARSGTTMAGGRSVTPLHRRASVASQPAQQEPAVIEDSEGEDDFRSYEPIDMLQDAGINATDIARLKEDGFATIGQLFQVSQKRLLSVKGVSESKLEKVVRYGDRAWVGLREMLTSGLQLLQAGRKLMPEKSGFVSASELFMKSKNKLFITTGSKQFDQILGGGIETMSLTEIHGEYRTGKTQLCHTVRGYLLINKQVVISYISSASQIECHPPDSHFRIGKVAFVDTEGTFRPVSARLHILGILSLTCLQQNRVAEIAQSRFNIEPSEVLDNIIVARAHSHDAQMELVTKLGALFANEFQDPEQGPFRLLIIDSVTALFRTDFSGRGELSERQQRLNQHLMRLVKHAEEFNIAVLVVNQVMADPGANSMFGPVMKPVGMCVVLKMDLMSTNDFVKEGIKIVDSPSMPEAECTIQLCGGGIADAED